MLAKEYCPHGHALKLLKTKLCARRRANDALDSVLEAVSGERKVPERTSL